MTSDTFNRKEFLKRFGLGVGAVIAAGTSPIFANFNTDSGLADDKKVFLREYAGWLKEFQLFVSKRNIDAEDLSNNKRLMELSAEADTRKEKLETFMQDPVFAKYFNQITEHITEDI